MKHVLIVLLMAAALILIRFKKAYRMQILFGALLLLAGANLAFSLRDLSGTVPLTSTVNQLFYQPGEAGGEYSGALLPLMAGGRTVYVKDDIKHYEFDMSDPEAPWEYHLNDIYYGINSRNLLSAFDAETVADGQLNDALITEEVKGQFAELGPSNDLYRFSFAANDIPEEYGNYFHYYFYYTAHGAPMHIYYSLQDVQALTPDASEELVALWQRGERDEDLYLMTKRFYDEEVAK